MRREHDVRQFEQLHRHVRLVHEDVEAGPDAAGDELADEGQLVDDLAARGVDETGAVPEQRQAPSVDEAAGLRGQRDVEGNDVGFREERVESRNSARSVSTRCRCV